MQAPPKTSYNTFEKLFHQSVQTFALNQGFAISKECIDWKQRSIVLKCDIDETHNSFKAPTIERVELTVL